MRFQNAYKLGAQLLKSLENWGVRCREKATDCRKRPPLLVQHFGHMLIIAWFMFAFCAKFSKSRKTKGRKCGFWESILDCETWVGA